MALEPRHRLLTYDHAEVLASAALLGHERPPVREQHDVLTPGEHRERGLDAWTGLAVHADRLAGVFEAVAVRAMVDAPPEQLGQAGDAGQDVEHPRREKDPPRLEGGT